MISISTKTGDKGQSGLANGLRLDKDESVFEVLGTLDELNSWLGLIVSYWHDGQFSKFKDDLKLFLYLQDKLFVVGAVIAGSSKVKVTKVILNKIEKRSQQLEKIMQDNWQNNFVFPGGTKQAARLDITRAVCRRLERRVVALDKKQQINPLILKIFNRLSDYLYLLRCIENKQAKVDEKFFLLKK